MRIVECIEVLTRRVKKKGKCVDREQIYCETGMKQLYHMIKLNSTNYRGRNAVSKLVPSDNMRVLEKLERVGC
jgi:hypothetical protein